MIDTTSERVISLVAATKILPGNPNLSTLWRWRLRGVRGIKLETLLSGGKRYTSHEALRRFQERVTEAADGAPVEVAPTPRQRESEIRAAEKRAKLLGV